MQQQQQNHPATIWYTVAAVVLVLLMFKFKGDGFLPEHVFDLAWWAIFILCVFFMRLLLAVGIFIALGALLCLVLGVGC